jgi:hypothetical protein
MKPLSDREREVCLESKAYWLRKQSCYDHMSNRIHLSEHRQMEFSIDAPEWIPAGSFVAQPAMFLPWQRQIVRGG